MAWGVRSEDLPGFVVLNGGLIPPGGLDNFNSGFLPATFQGSVFSSGNPPLANVNRREKSSEVQARKLAFMHALDSEVLAEVGRERIRLSRRSRITRWRRGCRRRVPELTGLEGGD